MPSTDTFIPDDALKVKHRRAGIWEIYEEDASALTGSGVRGLNCLESYIQGWRGMMDDLPYFWWMLKDLSGLPSFSSHFVIFVLLRVVGSMIPALKLWYSSQLVTIVQSSVEQRTVDQVALFHAAGGQFICSFLERLLDDGENAVVTPLKTKIRQHYSIYVLGELVRLDVPTSEDPAIDSQIRDAFPDSYQSVSWDAICTVMGILQAVVQFCSQILVMVHLLIGQRDGFLLSGLSILTIGLKWRNAGRRHSLYDFSRGAWAATTRNPQYILMKGLKQTIWEERHRQEIVAGNIWRYLMSSFIESSNKLGAEDVDLFDVDEMLFNQTNILEYFFDALTHLPQVVFSLRAVQYPVSIPVSLASLNTITTSSESFMNTCDTLSRGTVSFAEKLRAVRKLREIANIPNRILDGNKAYPEDSSSLAMGISIEFRNVFFKYPESDEDALHDVSFTILKGQLCVIVGDNGSGKSTILKLITRIYEPYKGSIYIDGHNIRDLKLEDLRAAISVLFQDYTHFPLSIKDNIGLGDVAHAKDEDRIRMAAQLGGALESIEKLPEGFDTFLRHPARDYFHGGKVGLFRKAMGHTYDSRSLSGGQLQRLALSRTFMRSVGEDDRVGLLLFDEPSASLDPTAEHDLFNRLRKLRGSKTMVFSSHRFGNLTRHADLLLYMSNSTVVEEGTHDLLIKRGGKYADIWKLQVESFLG